MTDSTWMIVEASLAARKLSALIGLREGTHFEAKGSVPYDLTAAQDQYELAKDVSALANAAGGWVIVGLVTRPLEAEASDEVERMDLLSENSFEISRIRGLLKEYIHPPIGGLDVRWVEDESFQGLGVGVIHVPLQSEDKRPFLIGKLVDSGKRIKQIVFGLARREGADAIPHTVERMHTAMRVGMHTTAQRLTALEEKIDLLLEAQSRAEDRPDRESRVEKASEQELEHSQLVVARVEQLVSGGFPGVPYYTIAATLPPGVRIKGFFREGGDSPSWILTSPPLFRDYGFDVSTTDIAKLIGGGYWEVQNRDRKVLRLYQDGTLLFRMRADREFLAWGQTSYAFPQCLRLNPVAIVESHTSFVHLFATLSKKWVGSAESIRFFMRFQGADGQGERLAITQHYPRGVQYVDNPEFFPVHNSGASAELEVTREQLTGQPNAVAFRVLSTFYDMFDAEASLIPFTRVENGVEMIDLSAIHATS